MVAIPLTSGAYSARSVIANAQRCVNLYPEVNPQETNPPQPVTHYLRAGLTGLTVFADRAQVRCLYTATNGDLYAVCGGSVYYVAPTWIATYLGTLVTSGGSQVRMADNGTAILVVDGSMTAYQINMATRIMSSVSALNASGTNGFDYEGAQTVDYMDTFLVGNRPGTPDWWSTGSNTITFDPLSFTAKSGLQDHVMAIAIVQRYVWVIGAYASELWYDAGGANFPFALVQGPYVEHGTVATYSVVKALEAVMWLSRDRNGQAIFLRGEGYQAKRVSTFAIENEVAQYADLDQTIGFAFQQRGHTFAVWRFPSADKTWAYDLDTQQWHELSTMDAEGLEHQWRINCTAFAYGINLGGDYENGTLYDINPEELTDNGTPVLRLRIFPHVEHELKRIRHTQFVVDLEVGNQTETTLIPPVELWYDLNNVGGPLEADGPVKLLLLDPASEVVTPTSATINLRYSDTRGHSWSNPIAQLLGAPGEYRTNIQWRRLGIGRDRVYEVSWVSPQVSALQGAYINVQEGHT